MTKTNKQKNSIPLENRNGKIQPSECKMYARNYSQVLRFLHSASATDLAEMVNDYGENVKWMGNETYEIVNCIDGWVYDRSMFPNTVAMEVLWIFICPTRNINDDPIFLCSFTYVIVGPGVR